MAGEKEIRNKIKSIISTSKITKAMEMVAASKMKKAQDRMEASRPYALDIRLMLDHILDAQLEYVHPYIFERDPKNAMFIVISSDRGLCGGLNTNLFKSVITKMKKLKDKGIDSSFVCVGRKGESFFSRMGGKILGSVAHTGDTPRVQDLRGILNIMLKAYDNQQVDRVYIAYNEFINTMTQEPKVKVLLPVLKEEDPSENIKDVEQKNKIKSSWDYLYEPEPKVLLNKLMSRYVESLLYQGLVENVASEQASRMVAMKNATDNANDLISELQLMYNKARQAAITQELSEIVSGAAAV